MNKLLLLFILGLLWLSCSNLSNPYDSKSSNFVPESTLVSYSHHLQGRDSVIVLDTFIFRDTIHDSIMHIDTSFIIDTTRVIDTLHFIDTSYVYDTTTTLDTLFHLDTIISIDTIHFRDTTVFLDTIPVFDTLHFKDTTIFLDTFTVLDTTIYYDTLIQRDTVHFRDTLRFLDTLHFRDTVLTFDTTVVLDTLFHLDTIISADTIHILDTNIVTLYSYDTLRHYDTLIHRDTSLIFDTVRIFDTTRFFVYDTLVFLDTIRHYDTTLFNDSLPYIATLDVHSNPFMARYSKAISYSCTLYFDPCCYEIEGDTTDGRGVLNYSFNVAIGGGLIDSFRIFSFSRHLAGYSWSLWDETDIGGHFSGSAFVFYWFTETEEDAIFYYRMHSKKYHCWTPYYKIQIVTYRKPKP